MTSWDVLQRVSLSFLDLFHTQIEAGIVGTERKRGMLRKARGGGSDGDRNKQGGRLDFKPQPTPNAAAPMSSHLLRSTLSGTREHQLGPVGPQPSPSLPTAPLSCCSTGAEGMDGRKRRRRRTIGRPLAVSSTHR